MYIIKNLTDYRISVYYKSKMKKESDSYININHYKEKYYE